MVTLDRIRLTGLLRKKPWKRGFFYGPDSPATRQAHHRGGLTAVSVEPPGAVARRGLEGRAGNEPPRSPKANRQGSCVRPPVEPPRRRAPFPFISLSERAPFRAPTGYGRRRPHRRSASLARYRGHLTREEQLEVGDRVGINGQAGIVRTIEPLLGKRDRRLVVQLVRDLS
jgi:hypothetical protein